MRVIAPLAQEVRQRSRLALAGLLGVGAVLLVSLALAEQEPPVATADALVDTPTSLIAAGMAPGAATASERAAALAVQLPRERPRRLVAELAGVAPAAIEIVAEDLRVPTAPTPLSEAVAGNPPAAPSVLRAGLLDPRAPIVRLTASADDPALAERLVEGGVAALRDLAAPPPGAPAGVRIEQLGRVRVSAGESGLSPGRVAAVGSLVVAAWLAALAIGPVWRRRRRGLGTRAAGEAA